MVNYFTRIIPFRKGDLSEFVSLIFVGKMCVFVSRPMKIVTLLRKNGDTQNGLLISSGKTHSENKIIEIVEDFVEKKLQQQRQTLEIFQDFACEDKTLENFRDFAFFFIFLHFSIFLQFSSYFLMFLRFFIFPHFSSIGVDIIW